MAQISSIVTVPCAQILYVGKDFISRYCIHSLYLYLVYTVIAFLSVVPIFLIQILPPKCYTQIFFDPKLIFGPKNLRLDVLFTKLFETPHSL